jgi:hypothetical protein
VTEINRPLNALRAFPAVSISAPEANEPDQKGRDHADRGADGKLIWQRVGKTAADKGNARDACGRYPDEAAQQPGRKECTEEIEGGRAARGTSAQTERHQKNEDAR